MSRLTSMLFGSVALLVVPLTANAQVHLGEIHALTQQLQGEVRGFSAVAHARLAGQRHFDDLCDDISELEEDLGDLDDTIHEAAYRPERLDRVARRANEVSRGVADVCDELEQVLRRHQVRSYPTYGYVSERPAFRPDLSGGGTVPFGRPAFYPPSSGGSLSLQIGGGGMRVVPSYQRRVVSRPVVPADPCHELRARVTSMESLAGQIVSLVAHCR